MKQLEMFQAQELWIKKELWTKISTYIYIFEAARNVSEILYIYFFPRISSLVFLKVSGIHHVFPR